MVTVDKFMIKQTIENESIDFLKSENKFKEIRGRDFLKPEKSKFIYIYSKGYWTVRYLEEKYPGFLKGIFRKYKGKEIAEQIRIKLGLDSEEFWEQLDELLYKNYKYLLDK